MGQGKDNRILKHHLLELAKSMTAREAASGISIGKKCPASGKITTWLPAIFSASKAAFWGGTTLSCAPNRMSVGMLS